MTKDVLVCISGLQFVDGEQEQPVEVISGGSYYLKNGKHYVLYEEIAEGYQETIQNTIKITENSLEVIRKGPISLRMVFEKNKKHASYYHTPFGEILLGMNTTDIQVEETEDCISVRAEYGLEMNYDHVADCTIQLKIQSKNKPVLLGEK